MNPKKLAFSGFSLEVQVGHEKHKFHQVDYHFTT